MIDLCLPFYADISDCGTVAFAQVLHRTNLIALVGGGCKPKFVENASMHP